MNKRAVIFTGGRLSDWMIEDLNDEDLVIGADSGALFLLRHGVRRFVALGDFDSVSAEDAEAIRRQTASVRDFDPVMKDWTDTELAFLHAVSSGAQEIVVYGGLGTRFDHSLANVHLLHRAAELGIRCRVEDEYNRVQLVSSGETAEIWKGRFTYVSLLPLTSAVEGITLEGFQYGLRNATLRVGESRGISNQLLGSSGKVTVAKGRLLVICSRD